MRTINYPLIFTMIFFGLSCSEEPITENENLMAVEYKSRMAQEKEEQQEVFELDIHQLYVLGQIARWEEEKRKLEEEIEGGNEKAIPVLESVMEEIQKNKRTLETILEDTCLYLRLREAELRQLATRNRAANAEWKKVKEMLEKCEDDTEDYIASNKVAIYAMYMKSGDLDICVPQDEWGCKDDLQAGTLLVNLTETAGGNPGIYFKSANGETISSGENVGPHKELKGVGQVAIELVPTKRGMLEFAHPEASYRQPVSVE